MHRRPLSHEWERYGPFGAGYAPAAGGQPLDWAGDDAAEEDAPPTPQEAGDELAHLLVNLKARGHISAKECCTLAYWAAAAGAVGPVKDLALRPGQTGGVHQRKVLAYMQVGKDLPLYAVPAPGHDRGTADRVVHELAMMPPHEAIAAELAKNPQTLEEIRRAPPGTWGPVYDRHEIVVSSPGEVVVPLALYMDGVPFTRSDGFLGVWVYNLHSWERHLVAAVRKSQMCACGCRKWCTLDPLFRFLQWSLLSLAHGRWPIARHDASPFRAGEDDSRAVQAGRALVKAAVVLIKGDWSEFCTTLGFSTWSSTSDPCLFCHCARDELYSIRGYSAVTFPHRPKTDEEYAEVCSRAEVRVFVTAENHPALLAGLQWDMRSRGGSHGRALTRDYPELGLRRGDRLEPCPRLRDVGKFEDLNEYPTEVIFWRTSAQTWATHRNAIFDPALGIGLGNLGVDTLHCLHLGIYKKLVAKVLWTLLLGDAWNVLPSMAGRRSQEELVANGLPKLKAELWAWYDEWEAQHPGVRLNRIADMNANVLGDQSSCQTSTKAAETRPLVLFCAEATVRHRTAIPAESAQLVVAAGALARFSELVRGCPTIPPASHLSQMVETLKLYVVSSMRGGVPPTPKLHLALHLVERTFSPKCLATRRNLNPPFPKARRFGEHAWFVFLFGRPQNEKRACLAFCFVTGSACRAHRARLRLLSMRRPMEPRRKLQQSCTAAPGRCGSSSSGSGCVPGSASLIEKDPRGLGHACTFRVLAQTIWKCLNKIISIRRTIEFIFIYTPTYIYS